MSLVDGLLLLDGIPLHPLIIHLTVVALPAGSLMLLASLFTKSFRKYDKATLVVLIVGSVSAFLASISGRQLSDKIGVSLDHATAGFYVPIAATVMTVFFGLVLWSRKLKDDSSLARGTLVFFVAVSVLAAIATVVLTILAGHSGAELVWLPKVSWLE